MASVTLKEGGVEVRIKVVAAGKPIDLFDITHPDDVEILRREVRAWRAWRVMCDQCDDHEPSAWVDLQWARKATDDAGALG